ncbi:FAD-linked oxidase [Aureimonas endophytica]|uniref:FAD-linked oxidase n=1 Tax=Aureimonas endophytica TaxID=2027858 RepID=A0A917A5U2_9HYPH|nr:FAD-binding oxidoreductase [Aureimonas endophytica]GGE25067.1 FAD-linked oxidase [Aureimonas endophytica]
MTAQALSQLLGPLGWLTGPDAAAHSRDWLDRFGVPPLGVARPKDTDEVAATVRICSEAGLAVVPQGGNTGLCGASVADREEAIILSLSRMSAIGEPHSGGGSVTVETGAILASVHEEMARRDLIFPMHLGAEGSARIGGLIGTNAGGSHAFRYGMMCDLVLGLEVVLADGTVWNGLREVQKDNAGYQLRKLFCGSEGTLGVVTRAVLRLHPAPKQRSTALVALADLPAAVAFGNHLRGEASEFLSGLEFFTDIGLGFVLRHLPDIGFPLETRAPAYVLVELTSSSRRVPLDAILEDELTWGMERGFVVDGAIAMSQAHRDKFWKLREEQPEGQRLEGAQLKHDISVPPGRIAEFVDVGSNLCAELMPGVRVNAFGHLADGNIHCNLSPPPGATDFSGMNSELGRALVALATDMGGSFAAEHGLGRAKIALAKTFRSAVERSLMSSVKDALDPGHVLNPGVLIGPRQ